MRAAPIRAVLFAGLGLLLSTSVVAQFNPDGRRKPKPRAAARTPAPRPATTAATATEPRTEPPSSNALIARYRAIALAQPTAAFPIQRLAELYRERDGNLDALVRDFEERAAVPGGTQYAALVALGGIYAQARMSEKAISAFERALGLRPQAGEAQLALARLYQESGELSKAYGSLETILPRLNDPATREQALRSLMQLALDLERWSDAERHHSELVRIAKGSALAMGELGRELLSRGQARRAVTAFQRVVAEAAGDNRALVPALRDLGGAQLAAEDFTKAITTLDRAARLARNRPGERRELMGLLAQAYRSQGRLGEFFAMLEREGGKDAIEQEQLGRLYEEVGRLDDALATYRASLRRHPGDVDTRLKVIRLLQLRGELDTAEGELRRLVRSTPRSAEYVFQLAEALLARGDREAAVAELARLEARSAGNEDDLSALVDFYERFGEKQRALNLLQRLARPGATDPAHVIELGNRYWRDNQPDKARETWDRLRTMIPNQGRAHEVLGGVYLEHDLTDEALEAFQIAAKASPDDPRRKRALAIALERKAATDARKGRREYREEAARIWQELLSDGSTDPALAREARQHLVSLWHLERTLTRRVAALESRLHGKPPDPEAGRLLGEVWLRLKKPEEAAKALEAVVGLRPGDTESLTRLERAYAVLGRERDSLGVLDKLVKADPKAAREHYQRMAELAARIYDDKLALSYARKVVELLPDDAASHQRLAALYLQTQDYEGAITAYRRAILADDRAFPVYLDLAELLIARERQDEASDLLLRVLVTCSDDELVARAARTSLRIHLGQGSVDVVERVLLSQSLAHPTRPVFRRLLIELYGAQAMPFMHARRFGTPSERDEATKSLKAMGQRATKPLLDALGDTREGQRRIALELLGYMENPSAGPAVITLARAATDPELGAHAMAAVAAMQSPSLLPKLGEILFPSRTAFADEADPLVAGAARAVAVMGSRAAEPLLLRMLASDSALLRGWGAIGLGLSGDRSRAGLLHEAASSTDLGPLPRAAAAFALGELGLARGAGATQPPPATREDPLVTAHVTWSLARLHSPEAGARIAALLVSESELLQSAGLASALDFVRATKTEPWVRSHELATFDGSLGDWLRRFSTGEPSPELAVAALIALAPQLAAAVRREAGSSPARAVAMARLVVGSDGTAIFGPLTRLLPPAPSPGSDPAREAVAGIAAALAPTFVELASHPRPEVRLESVRALASQSGPGVTRALVAALEDRNEQVQRVALDAIARRPAVPELVDASILLLQHSESWSVRARAAAALGEWEGGTHSTKAVDALVARLCRDEVAWVREAAARSIAKIGHVAALATLARQAEADPEPRVRESIRALLGSSNQEP